MSKLLVVDDDPAVVQLFRQSFEQDRIEFMTARLVADVLRRVAEDRPDTAVLNLALAERSGLGLLDDVRRIDAKLPVIVVASGGTSATAIDAMKRGAFEYLLKPLEPEQVREVVSRAFEVRRLMNEPVVVGPGDDLAGEAGDALVGQCSAMQEVYKAIGRVAPQNVTVLIRGESGSGKELVARAIYHHSNRSDAPFLAVNCAAIPEALLESELFGHEKGSFTGAERRRIGKFEQCSGGTIFLDEIGDMPPALQSKMLRLLQDQRFERVGGNDTIQTDVRIIAATHRDLEQMVAENKFRSDLYYRLNVYSIELPPLRDRIADLPLLLNRLLSRADVELGKDVRAVSPQALECLKRYAWPGNIRELQSVLKQAVLKSSGPVLLADFLPAVLRQQSACLPARQPDVLRDADIPEPTTDWDRFVADRLTAESERIYDEAIALAEREVLSRVLRHTNGNQVQAARLLGVTRSTLRTKLRTLGIAIGHIVESRD